MATKKRKVSSLDPPLWSTRQINKLSPRDLEVIKGMVLTGVGHAAVMSECSVTDILVAKYVFRGATVDPPKRLHRDISVYVAPGVFCLVKG